MKAALVSGLSVLALPLQAVSGPNLPDVICADTADMKNRLKHQYGAERQGAGIHSPDEMLEIWHSEATGEWHLVRAYARGISCIVAMGSHWMADEARDPA